MSVEKEIKVLIVEPKKAPYEAVIENTLDKRKEIVGGWTETFRLGMGMCMVMNEDGKMIGLPSNRVVSNDLIVGTFILCGIESETGEYTSLNDYQLSILKEDFAGPIVLGREF